MIGFLFRRLLLVLVVLWGLSVLTFGVSNLVPTDPARAALGFDATPSMVDQYRRETGLDQSVPVRYAIYVRNLLHGDLGDSVFTRRSVGADLKSSVPATLELTILSLMFSLVVGGILGTIGALRRGTWVDVLVSSVPLAQLSIPVFVLGLLLLVVFYRELGWFPYGGRIDGNLLPPDPVTGFYTIDSLLNLDLGNFRSSLLHLVLPALALSNLTLAEMARITRSSFLEVLRHDYIRTARAKGAGQTRLLIRHALPNAAISIVTVMGLRFGYLLGGAVVTETIFGWPGIGRYAWQGAINSDLNVVMGVTLVVGLMYSVVNLLVDLSYSVLDPRVRTG